MKDLAKKRKRKHDEEKQQDALIEGISNMREKNQAYLKSAITQEELCNSTISKP